MEFLQFDNLLLVKVIVRLILSSDILNATLTTSTEHYAGDSLKACKMNKRQSIGRKSKLPVHENVMVCIDNPKESTKKLLILKNKFLKLTDTRSKQKY